MKRDPRLVRLSWDHHHGLVLSRRILREAPGASDAELAALYSDVIAEWSRAVLPHFHAEGECLLARLIRHREAGRLVEQTSADHVQIQGLVADMRDAATTGERTAAMLAFAERLRDHIRWEEAELFARSQETMTGPELDAVAAEVEEMLGPDVIK
jgi:hypothetical protein